MRGHDNLTRLLGCKSRLIEVLRVYSLRNTLTQYAVCHTLTLVRLLAIDL